MDPFVKTAERMKRWIPGIAAAILMAYPGSIALANPAYVMKDFESFPISIVEDSATPQVQINASNDHQLYFKAYNDYSDLDDDDIPETTYKHSINYYGYFDSQKCYTYSTTNNRFEPFSVSADKYCNAGGISNQWSGNFLNWASMTRIDAIRKILFGGHRRVDTKDATVLERAFIPPDIHAFAKHYNGADLPRLTPFLANLTTETKTSTSSLEILAGSKTFAVTDPELWMGVGDYTRIVSTSNTVNFMEGWVTGIDEAASEVTVNVVATGGSGTFNDWEITNKSMRPVVKTSATPHTNDTYSKDFVFATDPTGTYFVGDYVAVTSRTNPTGIFAKGWVTSVDAATKKILVNVVETSDVVPYNTWTITNFRPNPDTTFLNTTSSTIGTGKKKFVFAADPSDDFKIGDSVKLDETSELPADDRYMTGRVNEVNVADKYIIVDVTYSREQIFHSDWDVANLTRTGITLCNVTYSATSDFSEFITDPPLIRVAAGNYAFWAAGEVNQCLWGDEPGSNGANYNAPQYSGIPAAQDNPNKVMGLGEKDYVARVVACKDLNGDNKYDSSDGTETCKQYPHGNLKPIGLLQEYGDADQLLFGMIAGTFGKSTIGGDMVMPLFMKNNGANNMCREINLGRDCTGDNVVDDLVDATHAEGDGTFKKVFSFVGGPASKQDAQGVINTWSIYRIKGYQYGSGNWNYNSNSGDKCPLGINFFGESSTTECQNWGNPFAEIYLTALRHWVGENAPTDYQAQDNDKGVFEGLNYLNGVWEDPLKIDNYCAPLSIINFNSSVISSDTAFGKNNTNDKDELDSSNQGIVKDLDSPFSSIELTRQIGVAEGISDAGKTWFIGETSLNGSKTCTQKSIPNLGEARGLCPEGPDLRGGFRIAGMAWYAHTNDIRPATLKSGHALQGIQTVDNYSVRLASGNPLVRIPVPGAVASGQSGYVTIIPSCIDNNKSNYGCTLADFKIIEPHRIETVNGVVTGRGKFLAIWEDSLQGNDYDLDAGGTYEYEITSSQIKVTTAVTLENLGYAIGHGYVISGTTQDGLHIHSGTNSFDYTDPTGIQGCIDCNGFVDGGTSSTVTYSLGTSSGGTLEDPLWYAAKWGGFEDKNDNKQPDLIEEWDSKINKTGEPGTDGIPDNYFFASHPQQLEESLRATFNAILERTSSGTAAAVVSSNVRGEGALFQAFYEPLKKQDGKEANWVGTLQALWLDSYGRTRQDCSSPRGYDALNDTCVVPTGPCIPDGILDNYCIDQVVETKFDPIEKRTRARIYSSNSPDTFEALSMQGVVTNYLNGAVTMAPNSIEGIAVYDPIAKSLVISPYFIKGTVTSYDDITGTVTVSVANGDWAGPAGESANSWEVQNTVSNISGKSSSTIDFATNASLTFTVEPAGTWINVNDILVLSTKRPVGRLGESFSDWDVQCLAGATVQGVLEDVDLTINNAGALTFLIDNFTGCTRAKVSSYNMQGTAGTSLSSWEVVNLETVLGRGTSTSPLTLANSGIKTFTVSPTSAWLAAGQRVSVSNTTFEVRELNEISYLWNAREGLYLGLPDNILETNRTYGTDISTGISTEIGGRHITTWVDSNLNGDIDTGEYRDFVASMFTSGTTPVKFGFLDVDNLVEAEEVVNYTRGIEITGTRNRTIKYAAGDSAEHVMRLGDIINSTPTVVGSPQEAFNLLYKDASYTEFRRKYQDRRVMVYAGGNDGLFHAFNGGFYNVEEVYGKKTVRYRKDGKNLASGSPAVEHPLGGEMWAYAPYNLLSHLKWLKEPEYALSHVYYMDAKPRVFDANIFPNDPIHPNGWGTVLVAGMNMGGGDMEVDTNSDDPANAADNVTLRSAYVVFDVTNPEIGPVLLGEIPMPDTSFTTVNPAVLAFRDAEKDSANVVCSDPTANCVNKWYLQFGTGPNDHVTYTSNQTTKMYLFDLAQLTTGPTKEPSTGDVVLDSASGPATRKCEVRELTPKTNIIVCDTKIANTFMGTPVVVDWDLNFYADTSYFGLVGDATAATGQVMRVDLKNDEDPGVWLPPVTFFESNRPVVGQPTPAIDDNKRKWLFFGSGRYYANADKTSVTTQSLFGVLDDETGVAVLPAELLDVSNVEVFTDRTLKAPLPTLTGDPFGTLTSLTTFDQIEDYMDGIDDPIPNGPMGWKLDLPPIVGIAGTAPATRNTTRSALLGGVLFSSVFQPSEDPCVGEGQSRLYGLYYKTGTAYPGPTVFGTTPEVDGGKLKYRSLKFVDLGGGVATAPAIHSGSGTGGKEVSVFTQLSTGDIVREQVETIQAVRTGKTSWSDR